LHKYITFEQSIQAFLSSILSFAVSMQSPIW
jgi:hypothetical protein